ncbi:S41 family peptidase [Clostridium ihumii]|uniref:S41 family peptidase n=1 Tax=Clostridium ihumii TaxID=1470356 RepID=UPI00068624FE|nr:S41 family peptidase [Clostridium ihumii]
MRGKVKKSFAILICIFVIVGGFYGVKRYNQYKTYKEDAVYLLNFLEDNYPYFEVKEKTLNYNFLDSKEKFIKKISKSRNDAEFIKNVSSTMMFLQNAHSRIGCNSDILKESNDKDALEKTRYWNEKLLKNIYIPDAKWKYIKGKYVIIKSKNKDIPKGSIITKFNGKSVSDYLKNNKDKYYLLKDYKRNLYYTSEDGSFKLDNFRDNIEFEYNGKKFNRRINYELINDDLLKWYSGGFSNNFGVNSSGINIDTDIVNNGKTAYVKIKSFSTEYMENDKLSLKNFLLKECENVDNIVIDIRRNSGGSNSYGEFLISILTDRNIENTFYQCYKNTKFMDENYFSKVDYTIFNENEIDKSQLPENNYNLEKYRIFKQSRIIMPHEDSIKFKGYIYVLVDDNVYSASEYFTNMIKKTKSAKIVGITTGGDGLGPEPISTFLPNSKLPVQIASTLGVNSDGRIDEEVHTESDLYIEQDFNDYIEFLNSGLSEIERSKYDTVYRKLMSELK